MILHFTLAVASLLPKPTHKFYDKPAKIELAVAITTASFDMGQTCHNLATGGREYWLTQSCGKNVAITAGILGAQEALAYGLHRVHAHKLERIVRFFSIEQNTLGIALSKKAGAW